MSKWYKIEAEWNEKFSNGIFDPLPVNMANMHSHSFSRNISIELNLSEKFIEELDLKDRIKAKLVLGEKYRVILKFKNKEDAVKMKLRL